MIEASGRVPDVFLISADLGVDKSGIICYDAISKHMLTNVMDSITKIFKNG